MLWFHALLHINTFHTVRKHASAHDSGHTGLILCAVAFQIMMNAWPQGALQRVVYCALMVSGWLNWHVNSWFNNIDGSSVAYVKDCMLSILMSRLKVEFLSLFPFFLTSLFLSLSVFLSSCSFCSPVTFIPPSWEISIHLENFINSSE